MLGIFFLLLALLLGWQIVGRLPFLLYRPERYSLSAVAGLFFSTWLVFLMVLLLGWRFGLPAAFLGLTLSIWFLWRFPGAKTVSSLLLPKEKQLWGIFSLAIFILLAYLFYTRALENRFGDWYSGGATWGDLALHLSLITRFAATANFDWDFSLFPGAKLTYPFLTDFLSAIFYRSGISLPLSILLPSLILVNAFIQLLLFFAYRIWQHLEAGIWTVLLFLFTGSFGGLLVFWRDWRQQGNSLWQFINNLPVDYSNLEELHLRLTNPVTTLILPQRGFLFGLGIFLGLVLIWYLAWQRQKTGWFAMAFSGLLLGLLPLTHIHTFLISGVFLLVLTVAGFRKPELRNGYLLSGLLALLVALPQLFWQLKAGYTQGFTYFHTGWERDPSETALLFWWRNWGPTLLVFLLTLGLAIRKLKNRFLLGLLGLLAGVFGVANLIAFQPFVYDNYKLLVYCVLGVSLWLGGQISAWFKRSIPWKTFSAGMVLIFLSVGVLAVLWEGQQSYPFLTKKEQVFAGLVKANVPEDAVILTASKHNHPVSTLSGRKVLMGYPGWLWSYGIDYAARQEEIEAIFAGQAESLSLMQKYGVGYLVIGPDELLQYSVNQDYFNRSFPLLINYENWKVYIVTP